MRILHCTASLDPVTGGPARSVPQLAAEQAHLGHEIVLWSADKSKNSRVEVHSEGYEFETHSLARVLRVRESFDLVHDHGIWRPFHHQVAVRCQKLGVPRLVSPRGMLEPWALGHKRLKKRLAWWIYQHRDLQTASALHATAKTEALQLKQLGFTRPVITHPNGIQVPELFLDDIGLVPNPIEKPKTVLFLSRIHPKKGLFLWLDAWKKIKPKGWNMHVVGPDEAGHRRMVETKVQRAGLSNCWSFSDALEGEEKWRCIQHADLFVLPTYSENFGIVVAEALAVGVPVITTTGAPWEGLQTNNCGWWVAPEVTALAEALRQAVGLSPNELSIMGRRGQDWVLETFAWPAIAKAMIVSYQQIVRNHI